MTGKGQGDGIKNKRKETGRKTFGFFRGGTLAGRQNKRRKTGFNAKVRKHL